MKEHSIEVLDGFGNVKPWADEHGKCLWDLATAKQKAGRLVPSTFVGAFVYKAGELVATFGQVPNRLSPKSTKETKKGRKKK